MALRGHGWIPEVLTRGVHWQGSYSRGKLKYIYSHSAHPIDSVGQWVQNRDNLHCVYCGKPSSVAEHVIPAVMRGPRSSANLVAACQSCNVQKGDRLPEWMIRKAINHLFEKKENMSWLYEYCYRVQILQEDNRAAERLASLLFESMPEQVVVRHLQGDASGNEPQAQAPLLARRNQ